MKNLKQGGRYDVTGGSQAHSMQMLNIAYCIFIFHNKICMCTIELDAHAPTFHHVCLVLKSVLEEQKATSLQILLSDKGTRTGFWFVYALHSSPPFGYIHLKLLRS